SLSRDSLATYSWRKDSGELSDLSKQKTNILVFEALNKSDDGTYSCEARNSIGAGEGSYTLHVQELSPPSLTHPIRGTLSPDSLPHSPTSSETHMDTSDIIGADPTAMPASSSIDHAVIGGVVAVIVFILLCLLIVLGRYLIRHKGTYLTHEAKGSDDAPDADTAIINAEAGQSGAEDKKEYFI
ncbi:cell adhesion molecule 3-like, partial [Acipenser ruthenus]|uniref:cell adhesion molecule 3-like n=1 Tax=Acipenser ruthenus TaxID=7906 RepID=UPI0027418BE9